MAFANTIRAIPLTSLASASISSSYTVIDSDGFDAPCFTMRIVNNTNKDITVSYDGTNDHEFVPTLTSIQIPNPAPQPLKTGALFPKGLKVWVKGAAGTGSVYLVGYFQG